MKLFPKMLAAWGRRLTGTDSATRALSPGQPMLVAKPSAAVRAIMAGRFWAWDKASAATPAVKLEVRTHTFRPRVSAA